MTLKFPIQEAISLIKDKSGKDVSLKVVDKNTINVGYTISKNVPFIGNISKELDVNLTLCKHLHNMAYVKFHIMSSSATNSKKCYCESKRCA